MARPAEKARAMLNKWVAMREEGNLSESQRRAAANRKRPHLASDCEYLADAERFRGQIVREISNSIAKIQNPGLGEHALRELNDEINKRMREKWHWNKRIYELGGLDYNTIERKRQIEEGDTQAYGGGYRYFGAAKDLPGVRELLAKQAEDEAKRRKKKTAADLYKNITPDYYGWRDEEDGVLLELEAASATAEAIGDDLPSSSSGNKRKKRRIEEEPVNNQDDNGPEVDDDSYFVGVPSVSEVAQAFLEQKKKALLAKYSL